MPKTRRIVANEVAARFLPSKRATAESAAVTAECLAALLRGRLDARLQPLEGSEVIAHVHRSLSLQVEAQEAQQQAHALLGVFRERFAVPPNAYGDEDTPKNPMAAIAATEQGADGAAPLKLVG